jgi:hypothetical protein
MRKIILLVAFLITLSGFSFLSKEDTLWVCGQNIHYPTETTYQVHVVAAKDQTTAARLFANRVKKAKGRPAKNSKFKIRRLSNDWIIRE